MFHHPEKTFARYALTLDEKKALLSGSVRDIEAHAGTELNEFVQGLFEKTKKHDPCHDAYFAREEQKSSGIAKRSGGAKYQSFHDVRGSKAVEIVEEFLKTLRKEDQ